VEGRVPASRPVVHGQTSFVDDGVRDGERVVDGKEVSGRLGQLFKLELQGLSLGLADGLFGGVAAGLGGGL
jgi:hypothetical protein